ncbi:MAG: HPF/RaiA family ribosome-associated protein [Chitinophagaceae bacterium]|nr:HPF/RaiA family ribosome-associated protein [Chitinophagaceae bacterium]
MMIQINTDRNLSVNTDYENKIQELLNKELKRFDERITRVEVHFSDENNSKPGIDDKKCLLEARLKGLNPIVVQDYGKNYDLALTGAIDKIKSAIDTKLGKLEVQ